MSKCIPKKRYYNSIKERQSINFFYLVKNDNQRDIKRHYSGVEAIPYYIIVPGGSLINNDNYFSVSFRTF